MAKAERIQLIEQIQQARSSSVVAYVTSTRNGLEVQMAMDCIRKIYEHLRSLGKPRSEVHLDLFLHSNGGDGIVPWRLVTLIREYAGKFCVLVPHRAFSAATLTALGADKVVMHPMGMLGPTDPTVANPFNPPDPANPNNRLGISVEDVTAYLALIQEDAGIQHEDELVQAFNKLADQVHPLALGNVKRSLSQSRMMVRKLLSLHMDTSKEAHQVDEIVDNLTSKLYYHGHPINRTEAQQEIGLTTIENPSPEVEQWMWELYEEYESQIKMEEPFQPAMEFVAQFPSLQPGETKVSGLTTAKLAFVESVCRTDVLSVDYELIGQKAQDETVHAFPNFRRQGWVTE